MQQQEQKYKVIKIIGKRKHKDNLEYLVQFEFKDQCAWMKLEYLKNHLSFVNDYEFAIMSKEVEIQKTLDDFQIDLNLDPNQSIQIDDIEPKDEQTKQDQILPAKTTKIQSQKQIAQTKQNQKQIQQTNSKKQIIQSQEQLQQQEQLKFQLLEKEKEQLEKDKQKKLKEQQQARKPDLEDQDQNVLEVRKIKRYYG